MTTEHIPYVTVNPQSYDAFATNSLISIKNASGGMEGLGLAMRALNLEHSQAYQYIMTTGALVKLTVGTVQIIRGILGILRQWQKYQAAKAVAETTGKAFMGPPGWAAIALAAGMAAGFLITMTAMTMSIEQEPYDYNDMMQRDIAAQNLKTSLGAV